MDYIKTGFKDAWEWYKQAFKDVKDSITGGIKTFKNAKKNGRSIFDQEYRDNLAQDLKELRKRWKTWRELARTLLTEEQLRVGPKWDSKFFESLWKNRKVWNDVAKQLIENWNWMTVVKYIDKFKWLNKDLAKQLIEVKWSDGDVTIDSGLECVALNIDKFEWLDNEIAEILIDRWFGWSVACYLWKFEWVNHKEIAIKLIEKWRWWAVVYYIDRFEWLDKEVAEKLIKDWYWNFVSKNPERFGF